MDYNNQYEQITVILISLNISFIHSSMLYSIHFIVQSIHWLKNFSWSQPLI